MTYLKIKDWFDYKDANKISLKDLPKKRTAIANKILSKGRVIITDRLHSSILSLLMGKPHVIVQDKYKKIMNTREAAFRGKTECNSEYIRGYYVNSIEEAIDTAIRLLESSDSSSSSLSSSSIYE